MWALGATIMSNRQLLRTGIEVSPTTNNSSTLPHLYTPCRFHEPTVILTYVARPCHSHATEDPPECSSPVDRDGRVQLQPVPRSNARTGCRSCRWRPAAPRRRSDVPGPRSPFLRSWAMWQTKQHPRFRTSQRKRLAQWQSSEFGQQASTSTSKKRLFTGPQWRVPFQVPPGLFTFTINALQASLRRREANH